LPGAKFRYQSAEVKPEILPGDQLVPAADMSGGEAYMAGDKSLYEWNRQHTELFALWPAKLFLQDNAQRDCAMRSYHERLWLTPCSQRRPRRAASAARRSTRPAARRNQRPKFSTVSTQVSGDSRSRRRIGDHSAGI
jgi:hypothetical protein